MCVCSELNIFLSICALNLILHTNKQTKKMDFNCNEIKT